MYWDNGPVKRFNYPRVWIKFFPAKAEVTSSITLAPGSSFTVATLLNQNNGRGELVLCPFGAFEREIRAPLNDIAGMDRWFILWGWATRCRGRFFADKMSDVVEKTLTALPSLLSLDSQPGSAKLSSTSKLGHLIRGITDLTSKHVSLSAKAQRWMRREMLTCSDKIAQVQ